MHDGEISKNEVIFEGNNPDGQPFGSSLLASPGLHICRDAFVKIMNGRIYSRFDATGSRNWLSGVVGAAGRNLESSVSWSYVDYSRVLRGRFWSNPSGPSGFLDMGHVTNQDAAAQDQNVFIKDGVYSNIDILN